MKLSCTTFVFSALLSTCVIAASAVSAQTSTKALFTHTPPYLCVGGGFIAMAGISRNDALLVIPIDVNGIEAPKTIARFDAINGMRCALPTTSNCSS